MTRGARSWFAALAGLTLCLGCAGGGGGVPSGSLGDPVTERFAMAPYPTETPWKRIAHTHDRSGSLVVWIPAGQDAKSPRDRLTREVATGRKGVEARDFAAELAARVESACEVVKSDRPLRGTEDGNDVAYAEVTCFAKESGMQSAYVLVKVIRGHEGLYAAQREFRYPPTAAQIKEANAYLRSAVVLCPVTATTGRCAKPDED